MPAYKKEYVYKCQPIINYFYKNKQLRRQSGIQSEIKATALFVLLSLNIAFGQQRILCIKSSEQLKQNTIVFRDSLSAVREINKVLSGWQQAGYLMSNIDSISSKSDTLTAYLHKGEKYKWAHLSSGNMSAADIRKSGISERNFRNEQISYKRLSRLQKRILSYYENNGFPFASIKVDSTENTASGLRAVIKVEKGPLIVFDSVIVNGSAKVKNSYLRDYMGIAKGMPFSQKKVTESTKLLKQLPYLTLKQPTKIYFDRNKAHLMLDIDERKSGQFDFILGVLPNENNKKVLITGEANLHLRNLFSTGKVLNMEWKKFQQFSQVFDGNYTHTRIFGSALDVGIVFNYLKQDTLFTEIKRGVNFGVKLSSRLRLTFFADVISTRLDERTATSELYKSFTTLPPYSDINYTQYGTEMEWNNTDDYFYPKNGFSAKVKCGIGNKNIIENENLNSVVYNNVRLRNLQLNYKYVLSKYWKTGSRSTLVTRAMGGQVYNENLFQNDLFRVGGLQTIRGFNEQFFFTSLYTILTAEYRFYTDETSYLFAFYDQSYVQRRVLGTFDSDFPSGTGIGISFTTPNGIFNFAYSVGRTSSQPLSLAYSRLHFGFVSRF